MTSSEGFQQHFSIISKSVCCGFYVKKNVAFTLTSFAVLKWDECLSVQLPFELLVQIPVQLLLDWLVQNVNELEFELSIDHDETTLNSFNTLLHIFADSSILKNWNKVPRWKWWPTKITSIKKLREPKQCSKRNGWMLFMTSTKIVKKRDSYHQKTEWHPFWGKDLSKSLGMASLFWFLILLKMN